MTRICECCGQAIKARKARRPTSTFRGYDDFVPAFNAARQAIAARHGDNWHLIPDVYQWARLPAAWVRCPVYGRVSTAPRDVRMPAAEFWPAGELPAGPDYAAPASAAVVAMARDGVASGIRAKRAAIIRNHRSAIDGARMWQPWRGGWTLGEREHSARVAHCLEYAATYRRELAMLRAA